jgi:hypothetical protein
VGVLLPVGLDVDEVEDERADELVDELAAEVVDDVTRRVEKAVSAVKTAVRPVTFVQMEGGAFSPDTKFTAAHFTTEVNRC